MNVADCRPDGAQANARMGAFSTVPSSSLENRSTKVNETTVMIAEWLIGSRTEGISNVKQEPFLKREGALADTLS